VRIINIGLLAHPLNWLTVLVWLMAIAFIVHAGTQGFGNVTPSNAAVA